MVLAKFEISWREREEENATRPSNCLLWVKLGACTTILRFLKITIFVFKLLCNKQ